MLNKKTHYQHTWSNGEPIKVESTTLTPSKVVCVGKNYADHIKELNSPTPDEMVIFLKPETSVCSASPTIEVSHLAHLGSCHHELEIALLIGAPAQHAKTDTLKPIDFIIGLGLGIDLTLRDVQNKLREQGLPWERAKAFDNSCALSPFIPFTKEIPLNDISLELHLNGQITQQSNSAMMLYSIEDILVEVSQFFTLRPGDVILTGTPAGVGPLQSGDLLSAYLNNEKLIDNTKIL